MGGFNKSVKFKAFKTERMILHTELERAGKEK
jgi:hypothetical protein